MDPQLRTTGLDTVHWTKLQEITDQKHTVNHVVVTTDEVMLVNMVRNW